MKIGDLVRYKPWPHVELHASGCTGVVTRGRYILDGTEYAIIDVVWSKDRPQCPAGKTMWEFEDELELVNESR